MRKKLTNFLNFFLNIFRKIYLNKNVCYNLKKLWVCLTICSKFKDLLRKLKQVLFDHLQLLTGPDVSFRGPPPPLVCRGMPRCWWHCRSGCSPRCPSAPSAGSGYSEEDALDEQRYKQTTWYRLWQSKHNLG